MLVVGHADSGITCAFRQMRQQVAQGGGPEWLLKLARNSKPVGFRDVRCMLANAPGMSGDDDYLAVEPRITQKSQTLDAIDLGHRKVESDDIGALNFRAFTQTSDIG